MEFVESSLDKIGLMTGPYADVKRFTIGALGTGFLITYLKPDMFFNGGEVKPWSWVESDESKKPTSFTLWHAMAVGGILLGVFV